MRTASIIFLFALLLQGCGHKGPLYVPKQQNPAAAPSAPEAAPQSPQAAGSAAQTQTGAAK